MKEQGAAPAAAQSGMLKPDGSVIRELMPQDRLPVITAPRKKHGDIQYPLSQNLLCSDSCKPAATGGISPDCSFGLLSRKSDTVSFKTPFPNRKLQGRRLPADEVF